MSKKWRAAWYFMGALFITLFGVLCANGFVKVSMMQDGAMVPLEGAKSGLCGAFCAIGIWFVLSLLRFAFVHRPRYQDL